MQKRYNIITTSLNLEKKTYEKIQKYKIKYHIYAGELIDMVLNNIEDDFLYSIIKEHKKNQINSYSDIYFRKNARHIVEKQIGRNLKKGECVHHIDGDFKNNNIENLQLFKSREEHMRVGHNIIYKKNINQEEL